MFAQQPPNGKIAAQDNAFTARLSPELAGWRKIAFQRDDRDVNPSLQAALSGIADPSLLGQQCLGMVLLGEDEWTLHRLTW